MVVIMMDKIILTTLSIIKFVCSLFLNSPNICFICSNMYFFTLWRLTYKVCLYSFWSWIIKYFHVVCFMWYILKYLSFKRWINNKNIKIRRYKKISFIPQQLIKYLFIKINNYYILIIIIVFSFKIIYLLIILLLLKAIKTDRDNNNNVQKEQKMMKG